MNINAEELKNKNVLLIGGAGFIGHNLALHLKSFGANVSIVDGLQVNNLLSLHCHTNQMQERDLYLNMLDERLNLVREAGIPLYVEDARNYPRLSNLFNQIKPEIVIFLAAVSHASRSNKDPYTTFDHSFRTLENALDCSRYRDSIQRFIYFSSSMVYGNFNNKSVNEESVCNPIGIYGALKFSGEKLVIAYNQVFKLPYTIIRPSALYGERCISRRVGQIFIENAIRGKNLIIKGEGEETLDFTYIDDLVQGIIRCIYRPESINQIFNLTYGEGRSLKDLASIVKNNFKNIEIEHQERDTLVPERGALDISKAKKLLDYQPTFDLNKGLVKYINWYKSLKEKLNLRETSSLPQINE